jgi:hypothetical protein
MPLIGKGRYYSEKQPLRLKAPGLTVEEKRTESFGFLKEIEFLI